MDPLRFDSLTRRMAGGTSRRQVLKGFAAALVGAAATPLVTSAALGGNGACDIFCHQVFGDTRAAGQCTAAAAHGSGLCYQCGPASNGAQQLCGTTCCPSGQTCQDGQCVAGICNGVESCLAGTSANCGPNGDCACAPTVAGDSFCLERMCTTACTSDADCNGTPCVSVPGCCTGFVDINGNTIGDTFCAAPCGSTPLQAARTTQGGWTK